MKRRVRNDGFLLVMFCAFGGLAMTMLVVGTLASGFIFLPLLVVGIPMAGLGLAELLIIRAGSPVMRWLETPAARSVAVNRRIERIPTFHVVTDRAVVLRKPTTDVDKDDFALFAKAA